MSETRRDRHGRFVKTCQHETKAVSVPGAYYPPRRCQTEARWYIAGYGDWGLQGTNGVARYCKRHGKAALRSLKRNNVLGPNSYKLEQATR
jgi:hypothetical protein